MSRTIVVNGIEYDAPEAMPPEVRRQYERALRLMQDAAKGAGPGEQREPTVRTGRDGVSVNVRAERVQYTVDGKTYDDPAELPPALRARIDQALKGAGSLEVRHETPTEVRVVDVRTEIHSRRGLPRIVWWLLIGALVALVALSRL